MFDDGSLQITWYKASGKRCVDDVRDDRQEDVKVFIKKSGGNRIKFTRLVNSRYINSILFSFSLNQIGSIYQKQNKLNQETYRNQGK